MINNTKDDLCQLTNLDNESIIDNLEKRYSSKDIYTKSGLMLLSINPYQQLDIYSSAYKNLYKRTDNLNPHIYSVIEECLTNIPVYGKHSIIVSGDSGSGKTECTRFLMGYLGLEMISDIDVIIESLGNAVTVHNNNSSRFGKLIKIDKSVSIETFLLEKSRVTFQNKNERNFHIFYYILDGSNLSYSNDYIDYECDGKYKGKYDELRHAFSNVGLDFETIENLLLGILFLGSIKIENGQIADSIEVLNLCTIFGISKETLKRYLCQKELRIKDEVIIKEYTQKEFITVRNSIARQLYSLLFDYVILHINNYMKNKQVAVEKLNILDIFGFEDIGKNGLDQFCINWCNEKIYDGYVKNTFDYQRSLFMEENINFEQISNTPPLNKSKIDLIENSCGIADLIAEESKIGSSHVNLATKLNSRLKLDTKYDQILDFTHFNGIVSYDLIDFVMKNTEKGDLSIFNDYWLVKNSQVNKTKDVISYYRNSLKELFNILNNTQIKYIKCIKPNNTKEPFKFDRNVVNQQLIANGVLESVSLSKHLFTCWMYIDEFESRYKDLEIKDSVVKGVTRIFFNNKTLKHLESELETKLLKEVAFKEFKNIQIRNFCKGIVKKLKEKEELMKEEELRIKKLKEEELMKEKLMKEKEQSNEFKILKEENMKLIENLNNLEFKENFIDDNIKITDDDSENYIDMFNNSMNFKDLFKFNEKDLNGKCKNCKNLERKYKMQINQLSEIERLENENYELKRKLDRHENNNSRNIIKDNVNSFIYLYIESYPKYNPKAYLKGLEQKSLSEEQLLSLIHGVMNIIKKDNLEIRYFINEIIRLLPLIRKNTNLSIFIFSNLIELKAMFKDRKVEKLNELIDNLFIFICFRFKDSLKNFLPFSVIDHQSLKQYKAKQPLFKKLFEGKSIYELKNKLVDIVDMLLFYHVPNNIIQSIMNYLLSYIDFESFNSFLTRKNFLSFNRLIQINFNVSELIKLSYKLDLNVKMKYTTEAVKIGMELSAAFIDIKILEKSFLNSIQINSIISSFDNQPIPLMNSDGSDCKFLKEPKPKFIKIQIEQKVKEFTLPVFISNKEINLILESLD